ncbi:YfjI family protein [Aeromonas hydrophila]|uniref:YfjI family protein n=1 Tax=Aeromonas hydrophila TaxID=644 RepID=UPI002360EE6B|nr:YfjI family protein [Aeromonas hydrophila]WDA22742.1 YfjI family protein [Aeromonas hydrophila]WES92805.1 YfjI family protein [Aeromonas hydrophila]
MGQLSLLSSLFGQVQAQPFLSVPQELPVHVLPDELQKVIRYVQQETQAPSGLIASAALGVMALACQDLFDIAPKDKLRFPISLYQVVLAESGERKSTVDKLLMKPVRDLEAELEARYQEDNKRYDVAMYSWQVEQKALRKAFERAVINWEPSEKHKQQLEACLASKPAAPLRKRLLLNDVTRAAVKQALGKGWPSLVLLSDEAGSILSGQLLHDTPLLNSLWGAQAIEVDRATSDTFRIEDARFGAMLMVQPGLFKEYVTRQGRRARASGFFARTLLCQPTSTIGGRIHGPQQRFPCAPVSDKHLEWFHERVLERLNQSFQRREEDAVRTCLTLSPEAAAKWHAEYNRIELMCGQTCSLREYRDYASKQLEHVARIAGVLEAFVTGNVVVSEHTMHTAIKLASYYLDSFIHLMADDALPEDMEDMVLLETWLQNNHWRFDFRGIPKNYLLKYGPNRLRSRERLNRALDNLLIKGKVSSYKQGRTTYVNYINNCSSL